MGVRHTLVFTAGEFFLSAQDRFACDGRHTGFYEYTPGRVYS